MTDRRGLPWYLVALLMSQPLQFGDYGGSSMQWLWALFDVATMIVLASGLYPWAGRARRVAACGAGALLADGGWDKVAALALAAWHALRRRRGSRAGGNEKVDSLPKRARLTLSECLTK